MLWVVTRPLEDIVRTSDHFGQQKGDRDVLMETGTLIVPRIYIFLNIEKFIHQCIISVRGPGR